jgi:hypothetical protein
MTYKQVLFYARDAYMKNRVQFEMKLLKTKFPFKMVYFWGGGGVGDWQLHPVECMTIPLVDIQTCRV